MKKLSMFLFALVLVATPFMFTSCNDDNEYYLSLVDEAVDGFRYDFPKGTDYYHAYNWFYCNYPMATDAEFVAFMTSIGFSPTPYWDAYNNGNYGWDSNYDNEVPTADQNLLDEVQMLCGEWQGTMVYEYTSDNSKQRIQETYMANMKFFQYNAVSNSLSGNGVEVDTDADGNTQTLDFSWYVAMNGDIYIKYKSGTIFVLDANSQTEGFHLGYENERGYDTFFGVAISTNTEDVIYIDLERQATNAKGMFSKMRAAAGRLGKKSFGKAKTNKAVLYEQTAKKQLRTR
nr:hypothetical protein [uncultured Prevotella sp.]